MPAALAMERFQLASEVARSLLGNSGHARRESLELLRSVTGATGLAIARWNTRDPPTFVAAAGVFPKNADHNDVWSFFERAAGLGRSRSITVAHALDLEPAVVCSARAGPDDEVVACAIWCDSVERARELRTLARLTAELVGVDAAARESRPRHLADAEAPLPNGIIRCLSHGMSLLYAEACTAARSALPIVIQGETGVGKEHVAQAIHENSARRRGSLVTVNCAAIPTELAEAELFGVDAGAATGVRERSGYFRSAQRGTLFLDEVGELPAAVQAKLLRAVDSQEIQPVGGRTTRIDVRIICATNRDLEGAVEVGAFRRDLYHRLAGFVLQVPPLRERPEDVATLAEHFASAAEDPPGPRTVTLRALRMLQRYRWPGNVRELSAEVRRAVHRTDQPFLDTTVFSQHVQACLAGAQHSRGDTSVTCLATAMAETEYRVISENLQRHGGNQLRTALSLGISRGGLALKMKRLGIDSAARRA